MNNDDHTTLELKVIDLEMQISKLKIKLLALNKILCGDSIFTNYDIITDMRNLSHVKLYE